MKTNNAIKKANKIFLAITIVFVILISSIAVYALSYFFVKKEEKIDFDQNLPKFTVERIKGNNLDKKLVPRYVPVLSNNKTDKIEIQHVGKLLNVDNLNKSVYLKMITSFGPSTDNKIDTRINEKMNILIKCNNIEYSNENRPKLTINNGTFPQITIDFVIQLEEAISAEVKDTNFIIEYSLVDENGKDFGGSEKITTKITQKA
jgi:flagellar basal body-associated protein FliL